MALKSFIVQALGPEEVRLDTRHNDIRQNDTQHNNNDGHSALMTLSITKVLLC